MISAGKSTPRSDLSAASTASGAVLEADLHCHLLPDWDDGARNLQVSLDMARRAQQCGVRRIVVTPHVGRAFNARERLASDIPQATDVLQREITAAGIDVEVVPGAEIMLSVPDLPARLKHEPWLTINAGNRYVLVESPTNEWSETADSILFELSVAGYIPIIAHPERLIDVQKDMAIMERAVERGALLQITARSIVGAKRPAKQCSTRLLKSGLVSFVASDAHRTQHIWPPEIASALEKIVGQEMVGRIMKENPLSVLEGKSIEVSPVKISAQKKWWFW